MIKRKPTITKAYMSAYGNLLSMDELKERVKRKPSVRPVEVPLERAEAKMLFSWSKALKLPLIKIQNEAKRSLVGGMCLRAEGLQRGFPDYMLLVKTEKYGALFIELKRKKYFKVDPMQEKWVEWLNNNGYNARFCFGHEEAIQVIKDYLKK